LFFYKKVFNCEKYKYNALNALQFIYSNTTNNSKNINKDKIARPQMLPMIAINYFIKS